MSSTINIPKKEYDYLKKCERIVKDIQEDEALNDEEIKLIEEAKKGKTMSKSEFLSKYKEMENA